MANVLLINPSYKITYGVSKASIAMPIHPTLGLATIAATARERGHNPKILDLCYKFYDPQEIKNEIMSFKPDIVGIHATTPLMNQLRDISVLCKDISKDIMVVGGGPHLTALPVESIKESMLDAIFVGEADYSFADACDGQDLKSIQGLYVRTDSGIVQTGWRAPIENLDDLPIPAWDLYDSVIYKKHMSRLLCKYPPITMAEFSRGCVFKCDFCASKNTMALGYRKKSPERCAEEVRVMKRLGYNEFLLADDIFTSDQKWAVEVCEAITHTGIKMGWSCTNGIRVESADERLFSAMRKAGCYRVAFGFETGSDRVLKDFGKGGKATIEEGVKAVKLARDQGIDTSGCFLFGLSPDDEQSMMDTIEYARSLPLDMMRFGITIAFPGTPMFDKYQKQGLIKSYNWDDYHIYTDSDLYTHPKLSHNLILKYLKIAYRRVIFTNPGFIFRRLIRGVKTGEFFWDAVDFFRLLFMPSDNKSISVTYYAKDRWPVYNFEKSPPKETSVYTRFKTSAKDNAAQIPVLNMDAN
jgi:anaerobic magnesium-protoporphyrin IX monomethyl ester cyclase